MYNLDMKTKSNTLLKCRVTGDEPMTGAQKSYLTTLCEEASVELPEKGMTKAEASERIDELKAKLGK